MGKVCLIALLFCLCSCRVRTDQVEKTSVDLMGERVELGDDCSFFNIHYASDSLIVVSTFSLDYKLTAYVKCAGEYKSYDFLHIGRGPGEILDASVRYKNDTLYVLSSSPFGLAGFIEIPLSSIEDASEWDYTFMEKSLFLGGDFDVCGKGEYVILGGEYGQSSILLKCSVNDNTLSPIYFWPEDNYSGPVVPKQSMYMRAASISYNKERLLYACGEGRYVSILDLSVNSFKEIPMYNEFPKYKESSDGLNPTRLSDSSIGVYSFATDSLIYLTPISSKLDGSEYYPDNYKGYPPYYNDVIDIYDWNGIYQYTYRLNVPFGNMFVNSSENKLYVLSMDMDTDMSAIYSFDL